MIRTDATRVAASGSRVTRGSAPNLDGDPQVAVAGHRVRITRALDGNPIYWGAESDPVEHAGIATRHEPRAIDFRRSPGLDSRLDTRPWLRRRER